MPKRGPRPWKQAKGALDLAPIQPGLWAWTRSAGFQEGLQIQTSHAAQARRWMLLKDRSMDVAQSRSMDDGRWMPVDGCRSMDAVDGCRRWMPVDGCRSMDVMACITARRGQR